MKELDYSNIPVTEVVPEASSMIESFRSVGYNLETAIADIIDNSISANAKNIYLDSVWHGSDSYITVLDDGSGLNREQLIEAMRPGSKNPLENRSNKDLGRFGLGLKTASFSQCRRVTVISKSDGYSPVYLTWDLDFVGISGKWQLLNYCPDEFINSLDNMKTGTMIIWTNLDRIIPKQTLESDKKAHDKFMLQMENVHKHLSMTFHRFIEDRDFVLHCWDAPVKPWNPFLISENATQGFASQSLGDGAVVKGYVLPHKDKISEETYRFAEGTKGWNEQQGFYVYRNKRLLLAGDWLGLGRPRFRKEEHAKLARIQIDIPNTLDAEWQIDIKKSTARPPQKCADALEAYAKLVRSRAVEVYRHRGKVVQMQPGSKYQPLWQEKKKGDKWYFVVNREHSLISEIKKMAISDPDKAIDTLLKFVEETIPTKASFIKESEEAEKQAQPFDGVNKDLLVNMIKSIAETQHIEGKSKEQIISLLINMEPFARFPELVQSTLE